MVSLQQSRSRPARGLAGTGLMALLIATGLMVMGTPYAEEVTSLTPGPHADFGVEDNMLGAPTGTGTGNGSLDVYTLGLGGEVVLRLDTKAWNGPGTDLIVSENPFIVTGSIWDSFVDLLWVEVSSNGSDFARFPFDFEGPAGPYIVSGFQTGADQTYYDGFAGVLPVYANPPLIDPLDVVKAGGDAFDFEDLVDHPLVLSGDVELDYIQWVRLVDVVAGVDQDDEGDFIWDCGWPAFASADVDALTAVNSALNDTYGRPRVELSLDDSSGLLSLRVEDDDGLADIKFGLDASFNGLAYPFELLLPFFVITELDAFGFTLVTGPVPANFERMIFKVSATDTTGLTRGDSIFLP